MSILIVVNSAILNDMVCVTDLDKPPSDKELGRKSNEIVCMWREVGTELGLEAHHLDIIERDNPNSSDKACQCMLHKWKQLNNNVSRRVLSQAIEYCKVNREGKYTLFINDVVKCNNNVVKYNTYICICVMTYDQDPR